MSRRLGALCAAAVVSLAAVPLGAAHAARVEAMAARGWTSWADIFTGGVWTADTWRLLVGPERFLQVGEVRHSYYRFGNPDAPDVVLLPGFVGTKTTWDPAVLRELASRYHVLMVDPRRMGNSLDDSTAPLTIDLVADAEFGLVSALGLDRPTLVGHSMGGMVVVRMLQAHGPDLGKGVLVSSRVTGSDGHPPSEAQLQDIARSGPLQALASLPTLYSPDLQGALSLLSFVLRIAVVPQQFPTDAAKQAQLGAIRGMDSRHVDLESIRNPVLVVAGTTERTVDKSDVEAAARRIPHARLVEIAGAHLCLNQSRTDFVRALDDFLLGDARTRAQPSP